MDRAFLEARLPEEAATTLRVFLASVADMLINRPGT
jgi:hypothetical protein